ncbi:hypothetical protein [Pedobacter sp. ASV12]|uniref:hypothetical protein n=1 Tax=Pedobacter sp. ASV12 TaxID=2795120 RepID=UPI0018EB1FE4|nr:hypothetical protein [Pedobacter sp. ASV12]
MKTQFEVLDRKQMKNILGGLADGSGSGTPSTGNACADRILSIEPDCYAKYPFDSPLNPTQAMFYAQCVSDGYGKLAAEGCPQGNPT